METPARARVLLRFDGDLDGLGDGDTAAVDRLRRELSACVQDRDGNLWLGTDELTGLSRLNAEAPGLFGGHAFTDLAGLLSLPDGDEEIDIEGMDLAGDQLWLAGSHTSTRKKAKSKRSAAKNLRRLTEVRLRPNRCLIARARIDNGRLARGPDGSLDVAQLPMTPKGNPLLAALRDDPHLGPFMCPGDRARRDRCAQIASKENGFDIEGVAVHGDRLFLGLRGPVLRGWALFLELEVTDAGDGRLCLQPIGAGGRPYRKHFVELGGMGIRDLVWRGDDLLLLAGPTMDITGLQSVYRFHDAADLDDDSLSAMDGDRLSLAYHLPLMTGGDKAEGLCLFSGLDSPGLLVVYDAPRAERLVAADSVLADLFELP
jgi:hypothetical protein